MNSPKNYCLNCGKYGHQLKKCTDAVTSYGILCFNINSELNITNKKIKYYFYNKFLNLDEYNYNNLNNIKLISDYYDKIKILMIRRRNSLNYVDFIRGKYDINNKIQINKLFQLMSRDENLKIKKDDFNDLWNDLWKETATIKIYQKEYSDSKIKFMELKTNNFYGLLDDNNLSIYLDTEWEFPKGRRNFNEKNLNCAMREFTEETGYKQDEINILERLSCVDEEYIGTNNITYRHVYYLASCTEIFEENKIQNNNYEISDIKWLTVKEAINKLRPYYTVKIKMIHQIYFFIINLIENIKHDNYNILLEN
jgi:8-oxo-dGTP pyrophosphatase MutT (NUDIX family)